MTHKKDEYQMNAFDPINSDFNLTADEHEVTTISGEFNNKDERIDYQYHGYNHYKSSVNAVQLDPNTQYFPNIEEISAKARVESQIDPVSSKPSHDKEESPDDCDIPTSILKLFADLSTEKVAGTLLTVQNKGEEIWNEIDTKNKTRSQSFKEHLYKETFASYLHKEHHAQKDKIYEAIWILAQQSYGIVFINSKKELLAVQNHYGTWSAPKGKPKTKNNYKLEGPMETAQREALEETSIIFVRQKRNLTLTKKNFGNYIDLKKATYFTCDIDSKPNRNDRKRLIGLYIVHVDETKLKFELKDEENKKCQWLSIDDILSNKPKDGHDQYYTLRPVAQYLKDHPDLFEKQ